MSYIKTMKFPGDTEAREIYDQGARDLIGNIDELTTTEKSSLVKAINEAAASGGSGESEFFIVEFDSSALISSHTGTEIIAAAQEGKTVIAKDSAGGSYVYAGIKTSGDVVNPMFFELISVSPIMLLQLEIDDSKVITATLQTQESESNVLIVTLNEDNSLTSSHSASEIINAANEGKAILASLGGSFAQMYGMDTDAPEVYFSAIAVISDSGDVLYQRFIIDDTKAVTYSVQIGFGSIVPEYTDSDNGKFLRVVDGVAAWATVTNAEEATF